MRALATLLPLLLALPALAAPRLEVAPASPRPGDPLVVTVRGACPDASGVAAGRTLRFFPWKGGVRAFAGLPVEQPAGEAVASVSCAGRPLERRFVVRAPRWRTRDLQVAAAFVAPDPAQERRKEEDREAFERAFGQPFGPPLFRGNFARPRKARLEAPFGDRRLFNGKQESQHYGLDYAGKVGAPVAAANDGRVVLVRDNFAAGLTVAVDHGAGLYTTYYHLSRIDVEEGAKVRRGQRLGAVGRTGRSTGPHLHFGVRVDGLYVDPAALLALDLAR